MHPDLRGFGLEDRNGDGVIDTVISKIHVPDDPTAEELAAASNLAARLAFETVSMDLPVGATTSTYKPGKAVSILIGGAARHATTGAIALPEIRDCEKLACSLASEIYTHVSGPPIPAGDRISLADPFQHAQHVIIGSGVRSTAVIDLAARIGLETTQLRIPLVHVARELSSASPPANAVLVGTSNPYVMQLIEDDKFLPPSVSGSGCVALVEGSIVIAGADSEGEAAALLHAALCMPFLWDYGKGRPSISSMEQEIRSYSPCNAPDTQVVFDETYPIPWEVDTVRERIRSSVLPAARPGDAVSVEVRLSESIEIRRELATELRMLLTEAGTNVEFASVRVLSAHKQGFCWIDEQLKPHLKTAARIHIRVRESKLESGSLDSADRWLHELYPIDEILARDLGISVDQIMFERVSVSAEHVYEVVAEDMRGETVLRSTFDPQVITRPIFDLFPNYANATVATGWFRASVNGRVILDERIKTDYERFWDVYQGSVLPQIRDYVLRLHGGKPQPECAPHFEELSVEVQLSEPDHAIGIDQERISTLEALHEDVYFETLLFFDVLGTETCGKPLRYPGRIVPRISPARPGPGHAHVRLIGYKTPFPQSKPFADADPMVTSVTVNARGTQSAEVLAGTTFCWLLNHDEHSEAIDSDLSTAPVVPLDQPIGPEQCERITRELAKFPEVHRFPAGKSWLGRTVWAMDVTAPYDGKYFSQSKAVATKPCLFVTGRQHANEVSSTSHILKLVELLATRPEYRQLLNRINFIIHPMTNPDGAALVDELHRVTPDFMLHAGYLGALGVDVTEEQWSTSPRYPEARVRADLWRMWQPDILLNPHGYPSHEWVQLFVGYTAWVKSREVQARDWWIPRGWFIPRFEFIEDERFPRHRDAALSLRDKIAAAIRPTFGPVNDRMYRRYAKYTGCRLELHQGVLIQSTTCGSKPDPKAFSFMARHPEITFFESLSEAPDEVASGDWLQTLTAAGLAASLAHARFLAELPDAVVRTRWEEAGASVLQIARTRIPIDRSESDE